jgi:hypothetical protein
MRKRTRTWIGAGPRASVATLTPLFTESSAWSSAPASASAVGNRSAGLFANVFATSVSTDGERPARELVSGRADSVMLRVRMTRAEGPVNGGSPAIIS